MRRMKNPIKFKLKSFTFERRMGKKSEFVTLTLFHAEKSASLSKNCSQLNYAPLSKSISSHLFSIIDDDVMARVICSSFSMFFFGGFQFLFIVRVFYLLENWCNWECNCIIILFGFEKKIALFPMFTLITGFLIDLN